MLILFNLHNKLNKSTYSKTELINSCCSAILNDKNKSAIPISPKDFLNFTLSIMLRYWPNSWSKRMIAWVSFEGRDKLSFIRFNSAMISAFFLAFWQFYLPMGSCDRNASFLFLLSLEERKRLIQRHRDHPIRLDRQDPHSQCPRIA